MQIIACPAAAEFAKVLKGRNSRIQFLKKELFAVGLVLDETNKDDVKELKGVVFTNKNELDNFEDDSGGRKTSLKILWRKR